REAGHVGQAEIGHRAALAVTTHHDAVGIDRGIALQHVDRALDGLHALHVRRLVALREVVDRHADDALFGVAHRDVLERVVHAVAAVVHDDGRVAAGVGGAGDPGLLLATAARGPDLTRCGLVHAVSS